MTIESATLIRRYEAPDWMVVPIGPPYDEHELEIIARQPYTVLDRHILGWGDANAIIRIGFGDGDTQDYLVELYESSEED